MTFGPRFILFLQLLYSHFNTVLVGHVFLKLRINQLQMSAFFLHINFFVEQKKNVLQECACFMSCSQQKIRHKKYINPLKFPPRNIYPLNLSNSCNHEPLAVLFWLPLAPSMPASHRKCHTQQTQFRTFNNWRVKGSKIHSLPPFLCRFIMLDSEDIELKDQSFPSRSFIS